LGLNAKGLRSPRNSKPSETATGASAKRSRKEELTGKGSEGGTQLIILRKKRKDASLEGGKRGNTRRKNTRGAPVPPKERENNIQTA